MNKYDPKQIEPKWIKIWEDTKIYQAEDFGSKPKYYTHFEFNYPSGDGLHVGHVMAFTATDINARMKRMQGYNVLFPIGWDSFGLPTENYAIKHKIHPRVATDQNIANFRKQNRSLGFSVDWSREIDTSDPKYYKWTQWIFLQLYKAGLAYQKEIPINWCPKCKIGLADEEVVAGKHERCGTPVTKKTIKQWLLKITAYADRLIDDLKLVDYPERVKAQQINWIGRSEGASIKFEAEGEQIEVFTTRPDTLAGATFMVMAPENPLVAKLTKPEQKKAVDEYVEQTKNKSEIERQEDKEKTGEFTGAYATNPITDEQMPIWISDYVLMGYGTGAIMAVPGHDQRDYDFAKKFELPIKYVVNPVLVRDDAKEMTEFVPKRKIVALVENDKGEILTINWGSQLGGRLTIGGTIEGDESPETTALREVEEETGYHDLQVVEVSPETVHYKYFAFSKNEAHDAEVNFVHLRMKDHAQKPQKLDDSEHGNFKVEWVSKEVAEREINEPLHRHGYDKFILNKVSTAEGVLVNSGQFNGLSGDKAKHAIVEYLRSKGVGQAETTYRLRDWIFSRQHYWGEPIPVIHCPKDGEVPVPESDLPIELPQVEAYEPTDTGESPLAALKDWVRVECPKCGGPAERETDTMPNWAGSSWYYLRYTDPNNYKEFADRKKADYWMQVDLYEGGMEHTTLHLLYSRFWHKFLFDQGLVRDSEPYKKRRSHGIVLAEDGRKMSKSFGNVINPDDVIADYGADTIRTYEMFMGPFGYDIAWEPGAIAGVHRFISRVWTLVGEFMESKPGGEPNAQLETALTSLTHKTIKKVSHDIEEFNFNTAVAALMEYVNGMYKFKVDLPFSSAPQTWMNSVDTLLKLLAPFAPFVTEELWQMFGHKESIHVQGWPKYDPEMIKEELIEVPVQVNGKLRGSITVPPETPDAALEVLAKDQPSVQKHLENAEVVRVVIVPRKLVNFVTK